MAGKTASCRLGITNVSITEKSPPVMPAATAACTAATSPRTITMYLPEQMVRDSTRSTSAAFSIASQAWKPAAMLLSSISPIEFFAICLRHNLDVIRGHRAHLAVDAGVHVGAQFALFHAPDRPAPSSPSCLPVPRRAAGCPACCFSLIRTDWRLATAPASIRRFALVLFHLQALAATATAARAGTPSSGALPPAPAART